jgi:hypothetical protein
MTPKSSLKWQQVTCNLNLNSEIRKHQTPNREFDRYQTLHQPISHHRPTGSSWNIKKTADWGKKELAGNVGKLQDWRLLGASCQLLKLPTFRRSEVFPYSGTRRHSSWTGRAWRGKQHALPKRCIFFAVITALHPGRNKSLSTRYEDLQYRTLNSY